MVTDAAGGTCDTDLSRYLDAEVVRPRQASADVLCLMPGRRAAHPMEPSVLAPRSVAIALGVSEARCQALGVDEIMSVALPRNIPWHVYPVLSAPWFAIGAPERPDAARGALTPARVARMVDGFDAFVVSQATVEDDGLDSAVHRYHAGYLLSMIAEPGHGKPILLAAEGSLRPVTVETLMRDAEAHLGFHYSYSVNFAALSSKPLREAMRLRFSGGEKGLSFRHTGVRRHVLPERHGEADGAEARMAGPYALQFLYALRRSGSVDISKLLSLDPTRGGWSVKGSWMRAEGLDCVSGGLWFGTGRHTPAHVPDTEGMDREVFAAGLVDADVRSGTLALTDRGERFLSLLHPDCEDADLLCRWRAGGSPLILGDHKAEADGWLTRFFQAMKAAADRLP